MLAGWKAAISAHPNTTTGLDHETRLWVAFVDARNRYQSLCDSSRSDAFAVAEALESMQAAYGDWATEVNATQWFGERHHSMQD